MSFVEIICFHLKLQMHLVQVLFKVVQNKSHDIIFRNFKSPVAQSAAHNHLSVLFSENGTQTVLKVKGRVKIWVPEISQWSV